MTDKEYIENIDKVDTDTLFENLEYYGCDSYYRDLWYATIGELKKRIEIRPQGEWIEFARWVAKEVLDNYFEESSGAFAEIACRKLVKFGLVEVKDNVYRRKDCAE